VKCLNMFFILSSVFVGNMYPMAGIKPEEVQCGWAQHIGNRRSQEDKATFLEFKKNDINYHLAIVCDGHGGSQVSEFTVTHLPSFIQQELQRGNEPKEALYNAFAQCDQKICAEQPCDVMAINPGTTVVLCLWDLTNRKKYIAYLGDSRLCLLNQKGEYLFKTEDHRLMEGEGKNKEIKYAWSHGGVLIKAPTETGGEHLAIQRGDKCKIKDITQNEIKTGALSVPRALGDHYLKTFVASDGTRGPVNSVPDIVEQNINEGEVEMFVTDGFTNSTDTCFGYQLDQCWNDILTLSDEDFSTKYAHGNFATVNGKSTMVNLALRVESNDMIGNKLLAKIAARIIYAQRAMGEDTTNLDNVTILLRTTQDVIKNLYPSAQIEQSTKAEQTTGSTSTVILNPVLTNPDLYQKALENDFNKQDQRNETPPTKLTKEPSGKFYFWIGSGVLVLAIVAGIWYKFYSR